MATVIHYPAQEKILIFYDLGASPVDGWVFFSEVKDRSFFSSLWAGELAGLITSMAPLLCPS